MGLLGSIFSVFLQVRPPESRGKKKHFFIPTLFVHFSNNYISLGTPPSMYRRSIASITLVVYKVFPSAIAHLIVSCGDAVAVGAVEAFSDAVANCLHNLLLVSTAVADVVRDDVPSLERSRHHLQGEAKQTKRQSSFAQGVFPQLACSRNQLWNQPII